MHLPDIMLIPSATRMAATGVIAFQPVCTKVFLIDNGAGIRYLDFGIQMLNPISCVIPEIRDAT